MEKSVKKSVKKFEKTVMKLWKKARIVSIHTDVETETISANFEFPGSTGVATFSSNDLESVVVQPHDVEAWTAYTSDLKRKKKKVKKKGKK